MKHSVYHALSQEQARLAAERALASYAERFADYDPSVVWEGERRANIRFTSRGVSVTGVITLPQGSVEIELDVPLVLKVFQKRAIEVIEREIKEWLEKARLGQL